MSREEVVRRLVDAIQAEDVVGFGSCYSDTATVAEPMLPEPSVGREAIMAGEQALFDAFADIEIEVAQIAETAKGVIVELILSARNDGAIDLGSDILGPTGRSIRVPQVWALDLDDDGLIEAERDYFDTSSVFGQLGLDAG